MYLPYSRVESIQQDSKLISVINTILTHNVPVINVFTVTGRLSFLPATFTAVTVMK